MFTGLLEDSYEYGTYCKISIHLIVCKLSNT